MKRPLALALVLPLALLLAAPPASAQEAAPPADAGFKVAGMKCFSDKIVNKAEVTKGGFKFEAGVKIGDTGPGSELADYTFPEDQRKQYFRFDFGEAGAKKTVAAKVVAAKTTLGMNLEVITVSGETSAEGELPAEWSLDKNWPVGFYKVFFSSDGKPAGTAGYLVKAKEERKKPLAAKSVTILSMREGAPVAVEALKPSDNDLVFKVATEGGDTAGMNVGMLLGYIDEEGKKQSVPNSEITVEEWPLEDTELIYTFEMENPMPVGKFFFVVQVDGADLVAHPFAVAE